MSDTKRVPCPHSTRAVLDIAKRELGLIERWNKLSAKERGAWWPALEAWQRRVLQDAFEGDVP